MKKPFASLYFVCAILLALFPRDLWALIEVGGDFGYHKQVYGRERQNKQTSRSYSSSIALYLFKYTAIELNYYLQEKTTTENNDIELSGTNFSVTSMQNEVTTTVYGIGIRQAFAGKKSLIRPMLSMGYAKQYIEDRTDITYQDNTSGAQVLIREDPTKIQYDSVFGSFALQIHLFKGIFLKGSVKTFFPAFEFDQAKDDLRYGLGFTWLL